MPKYWGKQVSLKWVKSRRRRKRKKERERERLNNGENNGQATHGARKHAWRTQAAWAKNIKSAPTLLKCVSIVIKAV